MTFQNKPGSLLTNATHLALEFAFATCDTAARVIGYTIAMMIIVNNRLTIL